MTKALVAGVALMVCMVMSGCSAASTPLPPPPTDTEVAAVMAEYADEQANQFGDAYPEIWENVEFVRFIEPRESEEFLGACARDFGTTSVVFDINGNMSWSDESDVDFVSAVVGACSLMYPIESMRSQVHTDAQLEYLYNYNTTFLGPCLAAAGFEPDEPPSRDDFVANSRRDLGSWSPYNTIDFESVVWGQYDDDPELYDYGFRSLLARCPMTPEGLTQWGW